jgi:Rrf2 family protein
MKLSRTVTYGLQATLQLAGAKSGRPMSCKYLARQGQMPGRFLLQVLRNLVTRGVLASHRGIDGGYILARPAEQITMLDIVQALDSSLETQIPTEAALPPEVRAKISDVLRDAAAAERDELRKLTIADLLSATRIQPDVIPISLSSTMLPAPAQHAVL